MWSRPHLLVLDEPTNYLDREALGALTLGIKEFGGGVIIISHNSEFLNAITTETWLLEGGRLQTMGKVEEVRQLEGRCCCSRSSSSRETCGRSSQGGLV